MLRLATGPGLDQSIQLSGEHAPTAHEALGARRIRQGAYGFVDSPHHDVMQGAWHIETGSAWHEVIPERG